MTKSMDNSFENSYQEIISKDCGNAISTIQTLDFVVCHIILLIKGIINSEWHVWHSGICEQKIFCNQQHLLVQIEQFYFVCQTDVVVINKLDSAAFMFALQINCPDQAGPTKKSVSVKMEFCGSWYLILFMVLIFPSLQAFIWSLKCQ